MSFFDRFKSAPPKTKELALVRVVEKNGKSYELCESDYKGYDVEYFPLTGKYFPRYKNDYLHRRSHDGVIDTRDTITFAECFRDELGAWRYIDERIFQIKNVETRVIIKTHPLMRRD